MTSPPAQPSPVATAPAPLWLAVVKGVAIASACFCLIMGVGLMINQIRYLKADPLNNPPLLELRQQFSLAPDNGELGQRIRAEDQRVRLEYFTYQQRGQAGARLLLGGALVLLVSLALLPLLRETMPDLAALQVAASEWKRQQAATLGLALGAAVILAIILLLTLLPHHATLNH
jgi:hypothetical protein